MDSARHAQSRMGLLWLFLGWSVRVNALVPPKPLSIRPLFQTPPSSSSSTTFTTTTMTPSTMYFDDVSPRPAIRWKKTGNPFVVPAGNGKETNDSDATKSNSQETTQKRSSSASSSEGVVNNKDQKTDQNMVSKQSSLDTVHSASSTGQPQEQNRLHKEKQAMIRKLLIGYTAKTASELDDDEIEQQTLFWSKEAGVVGDSFGDELYHDVLGVSIGNATSLTDCFSDLWRFMNQITDEYRDDEFKTTPHRWTLRRSDGQRLKGTSHVYFCVFPQCSDAYEYKTFTLLAAALEFCKDLCLHLGKEFTVSLFHPRFKYAPSMLSPERHSPFPTIALQFGPASREEGQPAEIFKKRSKRRPLSKASDDENGAKDDKKHANGGGSNSVRSNDQGKNEKTSPKNDAKKITRKQDPANLLPPPDEADEELKDLVDGRIANLDGTRAHLEVLFNSAAAPGTSDAVWTHPAYPDDEGDVEGSKDAFVLPEAGNLLPTNLTADDRPLLGRGPDPLARSFQQERKRRRRDIPTNHVLQHSREWAQKARVQNQEINPALLYWPTIISDNGWIVCQEKVAERVYNDIWKSIRELHALGREAERSLSDSTLNISQQDNRMNETSKGKKFGGSRFDLAGWMSTLSGGNANDGKQNDVAYSSLENRIPPNEIRSRVFVTTKFMAYNAQTFKRFAITINAALKRFTGGRMFLEVFHPEYVGKKGYQSHLRRSPFPMIQICYHLKAAANKTLD